MHILLTNDDGIHAAGILAAYKKLRKHNYKVTVVAPDTERSGHGHAVTFRKEIKVTPTKLPDGEMGFATSGTPADCARLGFTALASEPVDLVISGINNDSNLGFDINYSGTVAAALEASVAGIPAIACSLERSENYNWDRAGRILLAVVDSWPSWSIPKGVAVNINIPSVEADKGQRDWVWTRPNLDPSDDYYTRDILADGVSYYTRFRETENVVYSEDTDIYSFSKGLVTLSPIVANGCAEEVLKRLKNKKK